MSSASNKRNWALPKFGEWDVNNPASAEGYTVIFNKARDQKKDKSAGGDQDFNQKNNANQQKRGGKQNQNQNNQQNVQNKWLCCFFGDSSKTAK